MTDTVEVNPLKYISWQLTQKAKKSNRPIQSSQFDCLRPIAKIQWQRAPKPANLLALICERTVPGHNETGFCKFLLGGPPPQSTVGFYPMRKFQLIA